jgi:hypothetical protein
MKRFLSLFIVVVLLVSLVGIMTAFAGASISGNSEVYAGKSYTYTAKASYTGASLLGTLEGLGEADYLNVDASSVENKSISDSASITVTIPSSAKPGDTYTIKLSGQYSVFGDDGMPQDKSFSASKTITVVKKTTATAKPKSTRDPNATPRPTDPPTVWELAAADVAAMEAGGTTTVTAPDDTLLPIEILSDIKDNGGSLAVDFGTYRCTISGADISAIPEGMSELDLGMDMKVDEKLSGAAGGKDVYQLHFNHDGQFPCKISYTFKATESSPGDTVYLYYYYGTAGVIEGEASAIVDENGFVTFDIYHCSSYFVSDAIIEGSINSFESDAEIASLTATLTETQTKLDEALAENTNLKAELEAAQAEQQDIAETAADIDVAAASAAGALDISLPALIAAMAGIALLAVVLTMLICRVGLFKRPERRRRDDTI